MILLTLIWILNLGVLLGLALWVYGRKPWMLKEFFIPGIVLKLASGICLGLLYAVYYQGQGDTFLFYQDATVLADSFYSDPAGFLSFVVTGADRPLGLVYANQPRALLFAELLAVLKIITFGDYWILSLYLSFFSFLGLWFLANQLTESFVLSPWMPALAFLFTPTVIFWSSGVLKESIALGIVAFLTASFIKFFHKAKLSTSWVILDMALFILLLGIKYYTAALLIALIATFLITQILVKGSVTIAQSPVKQTKYWLLIFLVLIFMASSLHPNLYPQYFLKVIVNNHDLTIANSSTTGVIKFYDLQPTFGSALINFPQAVFSCFYRPAFFEAVDMFQGIAAIENLLILIATIASIIKLRWTLISKKAIWVLGGIMYVGLGSGLVALSTPNLGTLARYKVMFLPFLILLIMIDNPIVKKIQRQFG